MPSIDRPQPRLGAIFARLLGLTGILALGHPDTGRAAVLHLPTIPPPALPPGEAPPPPPRSWLQVRLSVPLEAYRRELDRLVPREIRAADVEEQVTPEEFLKDEEKVAVQAGVRWRGPILRGGFANESRGDTLSTQTVVHYRIEIEGDHFAPTSCGVGTDSLIGRVGVMTRFGWGDGWHLESRSNPLAALYPTRCKPKPPGLNFTKLVDDRIKSRLLARLVPALDSLAGATDLAPRVRDLHDALARPVPLGGAAWLHWRPGAIRAERPRLAGDALVVDLGFEAAPTILPTAEATGARFPEAPTQRLFATETFVPIDCWVDYADVAARLRGMRVPMGAERQDTLRIEGVTPRGAGDRLAIEIELAGAVVGRVFLVGDARCAEPGFALELPNLAWSEESRRAIEDRAPAGDLAALGAALDEMLAQAKDRLRFDVSRCVIQWNQAIAGALSGPPTGEPRWAVGFNQRVVSDIFCTDRAIGVRVIERGRVRRAD